MTDDSTYRPLVQMTGVDALIDENTPMRLEKIIPIAFPMGGMTVAGLRKEIDRGNLAVEKIANKLFTTLGDVKRMREKCRSRAKGHDSGSAPQREDVKAAGSSSTEAASSALESLQLLVKGTHPRKRRSS
jgi:hypothetical protein